MVWALCGALVAMATTNPFYLVPLIAVAWVVHAARSRPGPQARSFRIFLLFGLVTIATRTALDVFSPEITAGGVIVAALEGLRLAAILAIFGAFNTVSDPFGVLRLAPRRFYEPALAAALALSLAPRTIEAAGSVREAQRLRGIPTNKLSSLAALAVPVLETGMEEAVTLAESMDARGHGRGRRTRYRPQPWAWPSLATVAAGCGALALLVTHLRSGGESLSVSGFPLQWPSVSAWLLGAIALLAAPALVPSRSLLSELDSGNRESPQKELVGAGAGAR